MTITTAMYPVTPTTTPLRGRLLDAATVSDSGFEWMDGNGLFDSYNCMNFLAEPVFCGTNSKTFGNTIAWQDGFKFGAYGGATCQAVGLDTERMNSEVERVFRAGESTAVEKALMKYRFAASANHWAAPTDINSAGAVSPKVGVALLEEHAASNYVGVPTLHVPRSIGALLTSGGSVVDDGNSLRTVLGSKVAAGAGYMPNLSPTGTANASGERWIYATGEVLVIRGPLTVQPAMAYSTNDVSVLAERPYIVAVDCYTAAVRVTVT